MAIVRAVVGLSSSLGITTTAEGVETKEQLASVTAEGCNEVQGYLYSWPKPASDVERISQGAKPKGRSCRLTFAARKPLGRSPSRVRSAVDGPLALVQTGDEIELDVAKRSIHLHVSDEELDFLEGTAATAEPEIHWTPRLRRLGRALASPSPALAVSRQ